MLILGLLGMYLDAAVVFVILWLAQPGRFDSNFPHIFKSNTKFELHYLTVWPEPILIKVSGW
jgi:hypothetical protein